MELRDRIAEVLADDGWEGHSEPLTRADLESIADALLPLIRQREAQALRDAADDAETFAVETYPEDVFRKPTREDYDQINALLNRERGHKLDGISADCYRRALTLEAERLRARAEQEANNG